jgi:ribosomal protein L37E
VGRARMQATTRCPRCGYVLRYDGTRFRCDFCGYHRDHKALRERIDSLERQLRQSAIKLFATPRVRNYPDFQRVMPASIQCRNCSANLPVGTNVCPRCGTSQVPIPVNQTWDTSEDKKVFDYILAHEGTISMSRAEQELSISHETLNTSIERLKASGLLRQA